MLLAKHASKARGSNKESSSSPHASPRFEPSVATPRGDIAPTPSDIGRSPMNVDIFTNSNKFLEDPSRLLLATTSQLEAGEVRQLEAIVDTLEPEDGKQILA